MDERLHEIKESKLKEILCSVGGGVAFGCIGSFFVMSPSNWALGMAISGIGGMSMGVDDEGAMFEKYSAIGGISAAITYSIITATLSHYNSIPQN